MPRIRPMLLASVLAAIGLAAVPAGALSASAPARASSASPAKVATIALTPQGVTLPAAGSARTLTVALALADAKGRAITSGRLATPITLQVYGPSGDVLTATTPVLRTAAASVSFRYSGAAVANAIIVNAVSGHAFAQMAFQPPQPNTSTTGSVVRFSMPNAKSNIAGGFSFRVSAGGGPAHRFEMDTGSHGMVIPASELGRGAVGPGPAGHITYSSNGKTFSGYDYLVPVTLTAGGVSATTVPIKVLAVSKASCAKGYPKCVPGTPSTVHMLGVGFDRGAASQTPPELANPFLALQSIVQGSMHPGYVIDKAGVTLGLNAATTAGFDTVKLTAGGSGPGDWDTAPGCFSFPKISGYAEQCGTVLVDTGIASAILGLSPAKRPATITTGIPNGTALGISVGEGSSPVLSYSFATGDGGAMTPTSIRWAAGTAPFVNTGRRVIATNDYLYDAGAGYVGFRSN